MQTQSEVRIENKITRKYKIKKGYSVANYDASSTKPV